MSVQDGGDPAEDTVHEDDLEQDNQGQDDGQGDDLDGDEDDGDEGDDGAQNQADDDSEEIEHEGQKHRVPKALKSAFLRHQDYTRKTMELAEERRALTVERTKVTEASEKHLDNLASMKLINVQLQQIQSTDWAKLWATEPAKAGQLQAQRETLSQMKAGVEAEIKKFEDERSAETQRTYAKQLEDANAVLVKDIPGWGEELAAKLADYAMKDLGFTLKEVNEIVDPRIVKALHAAYTGKQAATQRLTTQRHVQAQATRPAATVGTKAPNVRPLDDRAATDAWMAARNKQVQRGSR